MATTLTTPISQIATSYTITHVSISFPEQQARVEVGLYDAGGNLIKQSSVSWIGPNFPVALSNNLLAQITTALKNKGVIN